MLGIRAERVRLNRQDNTEQRRPENGGGPPPGATGDANGLSGVVAGTTYLGDSVTHTIRLRDGTPIQAAEAADRTRATGDSVSVSISAAAIMVFPRKLA